MQQEPDSPEHHRQRSEFIRKLVQRRLGQRSVNGLPRHLPPRTIVQFWHDLHQLPHDIEECVASWTRWETSGLRHRLFDAHTAKAFIGGSLGARYERAFERCYHPAMQADYFRLCYLQVEGGFYVDADDVCIGTDIGWLFEDGRLKLQPLCYGIASGAMVKPSVFLCADAYDPSWTFYFNTHRRADRGSRHTALGHQLRVRANHDLGALETRCRRDVLQIAERAQVALERLRGSLQCREAPVGRCSPRSRAPPGSPGRARAAPR
jgi:hypothetical protein